MLTNSESTPADRHAVHFWSFKHKVHKYKEYHIVCRQRVCLSPSNQRVGAHSPAAAGEGLGQSQFRRLEKKLSTLPAQWFKALFFCHKKARQYAKKCTIKKVLNNILKMLLIKVFEYLCMKPFLWTCFLKLKNELYAYSMVRKCLTFFFACKHKKNSAL